MIKNSPFHHWTLLYCINFCTNTLKRVIYWKFILKIKYRNLCDRWPINCTFFCISITQSLSKNNFLHLSVSTCVCTYVCVCMNSTMYMWIQNWAVYFVFSSIYILQKCEIDKKYFLVVYKTYFLVHTYTRNRCDCVSNWKLNLVNYFA